MEELSAHALVGKMNKWGIELAPGLSDDEVRQVEGAYDFNFPPDLRALLQEALPVAEGWVNWRGGAPGDIIDKMRWPLEGMLFDIQHNVFWPEDWGTKPVHLEDAFAVARRAIAHAPTLIPICGHRYIPCEPLLAVNPVFSVYQTDIIYYGYDLVSYFDCELGGSHDLDRYTKSPHPIRFWDQFVG